MLVLSLVFVQGGSAPVQCSEGAPVIPSKSYIDVFIVSAAEFPGLILAALLVDIVGRKVRFPAIVRSNVWGSFWADGRS